MNLTSLYATIQKRKKTMPKASYVATLFRENSDRLIQKIGEEATEVVIAAKNESKQRLISEIADLWFHTIVLMVKNNITINDIMKELGLRKPKS